MVSSGVDPLALFFLIRNTWSEKNNLKAHKRISKEDSLHALV